MRVAVLGAGVVGVTTAYELHRDGHEVTVLDRRPEPAQETSFANAGMVSPGHAYAWSSPEALRTLLRSLWRGDAALRFKPQADPRFWAWCLRFARQCTTERAAASTRRKVRLALYAQARLRQIVAETGLAYGGRRGGALFLYRDPRTLAAAAAKAAILTEAGVEIRTVDPAEAARLDPVYLPVQDRLAGALFAPGDESGDARAFTLGLAARLADAGVTFRMNETVQGFTTERGRVTAAVTDRGRLAADAYVLATGCAAARLGRMLGVALPIWPVKGYSVTVPIDGRNNPPTLAGVDEDRLLAFANYGDRVRLTAVAELGGHDTGHRPADFTTLLEGAKDLFPDAGDYARASYWAGLRPMTPTNLPIHGRAHLDNLWLAAGHGHMGWTWAAGSARITADLLVGARPGHDLDGLVLR